MPPTRWAGGGRIAMRPYGDPIRRNRGRRAFRRTPHSVATIVGGYKGTVTRRLRDLDRDNQWHIWPRNYHEDVVRNEQDFDTIANYIETNPANWHKDRFHS